MIHELHTQQALNTVFVLVSNESIITFGKGETDIVSTAAPTGDDTLCYSFPAVLCDRFAASDPSPHEWELAYTPKVKLQIKRDKSGGGCG